MFRDVRGVIQRAAPRPAARLDVVAIARRSERLRRRELGVRAGAGVLLLLLATMFGRTLIQSVDRTFFAARDRTYISPPGPHVRIPKTPTVADVFRRTRGGLSDIPEGPQYVVASGRFEKGNWGDYDGKPWRYLAWGNEKSYCQTFEIGDFSDEGGSLSCTSGGPQDHLPARAYDPGRGDVLSLAYGEVSKDVAVVEFRLSDGQTVRVAPIAAPEALDVPVNYYVAFLPATKNGDIVAFDRGGEVLERTRLCNDSCLDGPSRAGKKLRRVSVDFPVRFEVLKEDRSIESIGINLRPGTGIEPSVAGSAAFETAWHEEGRGLDPDSAVVTLARLESHQFGVERPTPVWLVSLKGICLPIFGPRTNEELPKCAAHELVTAVDAQTGGYMFSYSYR